LLTARAATALLAGFGAAGYELAMRALTSLPGGERAE
jgi:3-dehydroquinate dehydratase